MKNSSVVRLIPFDLGYSFLEFEYSNAQNRDDFLEKLKQEMQRIGLEFIVRKKHIICEIVLTPNIKCYILDYGAGVFEIHNFLPPEQQEVNDFFGIDTVFSLYYNKKRGEHSLLDAENETHQKITELTKIVRKCIKTNIRPVSADSEYKDDGFSYVLSIYNMDEVNEKEIDVLMSPSLLSSIENRNKWEMIKKNVNNYIPSFHNEYDTCNYSDKSTIVTSWSAVAVIGADWKEVSLDVINYEISLQAAWFLYDAITDNIHETHFENVELQRIRSIITNIDLEIENIISANMSTNKKRAMEAIYNSSGIDTVKKKLMLLLDNRIAIEEAKSNEQQKKYGIITEILLVLFTLVSIYEPVKNLIDGKLVISDYIVGGIMLVALAICSFFIIKKER